MSLLNIFNGINTKEVLRFLPDAVFVVEESTGKVLWVNDKAAVVFEASKDELLTMDFEDLVVNGLQLAEQSSYKDVAVIGGAVVNGREFYIELSANLLENQYFVTIRDVTEMTNVLAQAEKTGRLNTDKNLMLTKLTGEFKSPVQSILGFSQALNDGLGGEINEKQRKYVRIINKNAKELLYFMEKFFEFAQVESKLYEKSVKAFDVVELVQSVVRDNEVTIASKKLNVNVNYETLRNHFITSDQNALKIVLQNVFEISLKLTEIGTITIDIFNPPLEDVKEVGLAPDKDATEQSYLMIKISDNGIGLQQAEVDGIFEPYTQLDKTNKKNLVRSISLGSAKELVKTLNGAIWLETEVMKGSVFNLIIPSVDGDLPADE